MRCRQDPLTPHAGLRSGRHFLLSPKDRNPVYLRANLGIPGMLRLVNSPFASPALPRDTGT
ncbi:hypothetical protein INR49_003022 [Caranx melampygus]|nr:hypothetical protein INR49_003022 [Caranx melampygus]